MNNNRNFIKTTKRKSLDWNEYQERVEAKKKHKRQRGKERDVWDVEEFD